MKISLQSLCSQTQTSMIRVCFVVLCIPLLAYSVPIFHRGGYKNLVISISEYVLQTKDFNDFKLETIEVVLNKFSDLLYQATHGLAYIDQAIVVLPKNWQAGISDNYPAKADTAVADIRIDQKNEEYGDKPYTLQTGECGDPGRYIHLDPEFIIHAGRNTSFIPQAARLLLHEWAHFRYGVFDEHSLAEKESSFRWVKHKLLPPTCPEGVKGWARQGLHPYKKCHMQCDRVLGNCVFFLDPDARYNMSIMSHPHVDHVDFFCDNSTHNQKAMVPQNRMCKGMSIFDVILRHEDFWNVTRYKWPGKRNVQIVWKKGYSKRIVFVVDSSVFMAKENRLEIMKHSLSRIILDRVPKGAYIGLVNYSTSVDELHNLVQISDKTLDKLLQAVKKIDLRRFPGKLKMCEGILKGMEMLGRNGGMVIVISGGDSRVAWHLLDKIENSSTVISYIAFGKGKSSRLGEVARKSGGSSYFLETKPATARSTDVDMALIASLSALSDVDNAPVVVLHERKVFRQGDTFEFHLDDRIGKNTLVTLVWDITSKRPTVSINNDMKPALPSKEENRTEVNRMKWTIPNAKGKYTLKVDSTDPEKPIGVIIDVIVTSEAKDPTNPPVRLQSWTTSSKANIGYGIARHQRIYASLKKGYDPVAHAIVKATVELLDQPPVSVILRDDGSPPDLRKNDGIYSNYFPLMKRRMGHAVITVRAETSSKTQLVKPESNKTISSLGYVHEDDYNKLKIALQESRNSKDSKEQFNDSIDFDTPNRVCNIRELTQESPTKYEKLDSFSRVVMVNSPLLDSITENDIKKVRPPTIRDLKVVWESKDREDSYNVTLQWTVPADPRPGMNVSRIELFGFPRFTLTPDNYSDVYYMYEALKPNEVMEKNISMHPILLTDYENNRISNYYFFVRPYDQNGNVGEFSNIAQAFFQRPPFKYDEMRRQSQLRERAEERKMMRKKDIVVWTAAVGTVFVCALMGILGVVGLMQRRRRLNGTAEEGQAQEGNVLGSVLSYVDNIIPASVSASISSVSHGIYSSYQNVSLKLFGPPP